MNKIISIIIIYALFIGSLFLYIGFSCDKVIINKLESSLATDYPLNTYSTTKGEFIITNKSFEEGQRVCRDNI